MIVDTFCFFEKYQTDMLLVKFNVEDKGVDEWVISENTFSMRGDYKGPHQLRNILATDKRFERFLPKIKLFEIEIERKCAPGVEDWEIIFLQREVMREYLFDKYPENTWILVSDADEIMDFADPMKALKVYNNLREYKGQIIHPDPIFFAFDYDNTFSSLGEWLGLVFVELSYFEKHKLRLEQPRLQHTDGHRMKWSKTGYHYHSCVTPQNIWKKLNTYGHTGFCKDDVNQWLYYNHGMFKTLEGEGVDPNRFTLETVELTDENSPLYVRENIGWLKTHSVHPDYRENRRKWLAGDKTFPDIVGGE
jgi:hypothetical protein